MPVRVARSPISLTEPLRRLTAVLLATMALAAAAQPGQATAQVQPSVTADVEASPPPAGREDPAPTKTPAQTQTEALEELIDASNESRV